MRIALTFAVLIIPGEGEAEYGLVDAQRVGRLGNHDICADCQVKEAKNIQQHMGY
jgi:hypothetical protein